MNKLMVYNSGSNSTDENSEDFQISLGLDAKTGYIEMKMLKRSFLPELSGFLRGATKEQRN